MHPDSVLPYRLQKSSNTSTVLLQNLYVVLRLLYSCFNISTGFERCNSIKLPTALFKIYWSYLRYVYKIYLRLQIKQDILWISLAENRKCPKYSVKISHTAFWKNYPTRWSWYKVTDRCSGITYKQIVVLYFVRKHLIILIRVCVSENV
jgi:hypothetical protein